MLAEEARSIDELSAEAKRGDLLAFCAGAGYGKSRERMGVVIHSSRLAPETD